MIAYFLQIALCMTVFYGFYHVALRKETLFKSNRIYLLATLALSFLLPLISVYVESQEQSALVQAPLYLGSYVQSFSQDISILPEKSTLSWLTIVITLYGIVAIVLLIKMVWSILAIRRIKRRGTVQQVASQTCIVSGEIKCPFSFFNVIYMPMDHSFSDEELCEVIRHEKAHVLGNHSLDVLFVEVACAILWLNPIVYLYRKSLKDLHEYMADEAVIEETPWDAYAQLLVTHKDTSFQTRLSNHLIFSQLKKRLLMMNKQRTGITGRLKYFGILPVLLIALVLFSFRQQDQQRDIERSDIRVNVSPEPVLYIHSDKRYFMNGTEVFIDQLGDVFKAVTQHKTDWTIAVVMHDDLTVADFSNVSDIGTKLHIGTELHIGSEWDDYKQEMNKMILALDKHKLDPLSEGSPLITVLKPLSPLDAKLDPLDMEFPVFPGCAHLSMDEQQKCSTEKLYAFISDNLVYPEMLKKEGVEGKVMVKFVVNAEGLIKDVTILRSFHAEADKVVLALINSMNTKAGKWSPAIKYGKAIDAEMILPVSFVTSVEADNAPLMYAEEMPRLECDGSTHALMYQFIAQHLKYPAADKANNLEGHCIAQFTITTHGKMIDLQILRSPSETMKEEVLRVLNLMAESKTWIPAKNGGKPVELRFTIPVKFILGDENKATDSESPDQQIENVAETKEQHISVIPNPASTVVIVELFEGAHTVIIVDADGKHVLSKKVDHLDKEMSFNISDLPIGRYVAQVVSNSKVKSGAFVKQ